MSARFFPATRMAIGLAAVLGACTLRCSSSGDSASMQPLPPGTFLEGAGAADASWLMARKLDYLRFETREWHPENPTNVLAHLARKRLEPGYAPPGQVAGNAWDGFLKNVDALDDGRDFTALDLTIMLYAFGDDPTITPELRKRIEDTLTRFKLWYSDPTPPGVTDNSYYWSENHQVLYHTIELLVGQRYPDQTVGTDGKLGRDHEAIAKTRLIAWMKNRLRFGFSEWHSNVYYQKDVTPLLALVEYADDEEIRARASMVLDTLFLDFALHTLRDAFGVTHGRSYKKDKMTSTDEDTWSLTKLVFASSKYDYSPSDDGAAIFSATTKYTFPEIVRRIAADPNPLVDRERMSLPIAEAPPVDPDLPAPAGFSYQSPDDLMVWWGMGALNAWPVVPATISELERYNLWGNKTLSDAASFRMFTGSPDFAQSLSANTHAMFDYALLREVDTYTYRTSDVMLSSAIDYRKGTFNQHMHSWQATLDARAIVFTNHPFRPLATSGDWLDDPEDGGYWNGEATAPRSAQFENVAIHIYAPQYPKTNAAPFDYFHYEPYTHAYFPQEYFDEVVASGPWTFGRLGKGYVGLYSYRPAKYLVYNGTTQATGGRTKPFDLVADGGADNVWIVECGRESDAGSFQAFQDKVSAARITVTSRGAAKSTGESPGFDVVYVSPSKGEVHFGWEMPFTVGGKDVLLRGPGRYDNPYAHVTSDPTEIVFERDGVGLRLDVPNGRRTLYGPK
jgi:hypothetical protein